MLIWQWNQWLYKETGSTTRQNDSTLGISADDNNNIIRLYFFPRRFRVLMKFLNVHGPRSIVNKKRDSSHDRQILTREMSVFV